MEGQNVFGSQNVKNKDLSVGEYIYIFQERKY